MNNVFGATCFRILVVFQDGVIEFDVWAPDVRLTGGRASLKVDFGYSDAVDIFLNDALVFSGDSSYRLRDSSFLGIVGYWDSVNLPLRKGDNELLLAVSEGFGGWGFMARETAKSLRVPESAAYDPVRKVVYVSVFKPRFSKRGSVGERVKRRLEDENTRKITQGIPGTDGRAGDLASLGRERLGGKTIRCREGGPGGLAARLSSQDGLDRPFRGASEFHRHPAPGRQDKPQ